MARKKIETVATMESTLETLIPEYGQAKEEMDVIKKRTDSLNKDIKNLMRDQNIKEAGGGGYIAKVIIQKRESMNEEMLLDILNKAPGISAIRKDIIKTKEYIDFDALENAIYNHKISNEILIEMDKAKDVKEVETLRISKVKEEKDE